jgi:hypothetical protein
MTPWRAPASPDEPHVSEGAAARILARFSERTTVRRLARGLAGELLLADHEGDIVDPGVDPRIFTRVPTDLAPERYAYITLLMGGEAYLPGCLVVGAALRSGRSSETPTAAKGGGAVVGKSELEVVRRGELHPRGLRGIQRGTRRRYSS